MERPITYEVSKEMVCPRGLGEGIVVSQPLTGREEEVAVLVSKGFNNRVVASNLGISEQTVKNHLILIIELDLLY